MIRKFFQYGMAALMLVALTVPAGATTKKKSRRATVQPTPAYEPGGTPRTRAASVVVADAVSGAVLYEKNSNEARQPASTQKLLTALLVVEAGNLDKPVLIHEIDTFAEPVKLGVRPGEIYTRRELLRVLLVHSVNDVARALARDNAGSIEAFADKMNAKARQLGMLHSNFVNPNGLPAPGQYSTARDMARLALAAYRSATIRLIVGTKDLAFQFNSGRVETFSNTNKMLRTLPYCTGMKTGYTQIAGHCLISSGSQNGREVITVVLGDKDRDCLWRDSSALLSWGLSKS
ncbi:MAG: D-alanyl-D-alanine carboxypeptidase family protein [Chthoniobacteraceae bacterium]